jgi:hypothetical protein
MSPRGEYRFHLKAANGEIIASSEGYSKPSCGPAAGCGSFSPTGLKVALPQQVSRMARK